VGDDETESIGELAHGHNSPNLPEKFDQAHGQNKHDKEDQQLKNKINDPVETNHGIESTPLTSQVRVRHGRAFPRSRN
jgi:hypothetical protein